MHSFQLNPFLCLKILVRTAMPGVLAWIRSHNGVVATCSGVLLDRYESPCSVVSKNRNIVYHREHDENRSTNRISEA